MFSSNSLPYFLSDLSLNLLLNFIDLVIETRAAYEALRSGEYDQLGREIGKLISDIGVKSPMSEAWRFENSEVFKKEGEPPLWVSQVVVPKVVKGAQRIGILRASGPQEDELLWALERAKYRLL